MSIVQFQWSCAYCPDVLVFGLSEEQFPGRCMYAKLFGGLVHRDFGLKVIFYSLTLKSNERSFDTNAI